MSEKAGQKTPDINTPEGMLWHLLVRNRNGVWFIHINGRYFPLPRWMYGHCGRACPTPRGVDD